MIVTMTIIMAVSLKLILARLHSNIISAYTDHITEVTLCRMLQEQRSCLTNSVFDQLYILAIFVIGS